MTLRFLTGKGVMVPFKEIRNNGKRAGRGDEDYPVLSYYIKKGSKFLGKVKSFTLSNRLKN